VVNPNKCAAPVDLPTLAGQQNDKSMRTIVDSTRRCRYARFSGQLPASWAVGPHPLGHQS
jgi:hypothetical protein